MPRPKRTKIVPSVPTSCLSNPITSASPILQRRNPIQQASERVENSTDDSDGLVTTLTRIRKRSCAVDQDVSMSGGLGDGDVKNAHRRPGVTRRKAEMSRVAKEADHANALEGLKRRRDAALAAQRGEVLVPFTATEEIIAKPVERDEVEPALMRSSAVGEEVTRRVLGTPGMETSVLAIANFKRRPRQPSILRMVERGNDDDDVDEDDFNPDNESTPLNLSKSRSGIATDAGSAVLSSELPITSSSRKRKLTRLDDQALHSSLPLPAEPFHVPATAGDSSESLDLPDEYQNVHQSIEQPAERSSPPRIWSETMAPPRSSSPLQPSRPNSKHSTKATKTVTTSQPTQLRRQNPSRKNPQPPTTSTTASFPNHFPSSSPPHPTRLPQGRSNKTTKHPSISSAALQTLLPRRRRRAAHNDSFDIPSSDVEVDASGLGADDDELTHLPVKRLRGRKKDGGKVTGLRGEKGEMTKMLAKDPKRKAAAAKAATIEPKRTYTRRSSSDKENNDSLYGLSSPPSHSPTSQSPTHAAAPPTTVREVGSSASNPSDAAVIGENRKTSNDLQTAVRKFRDVDRWEMEFEEVTASSSSPWDAR
ncbi:MAG: hypothetical protein M1827_002668 [Pycnora praestabilis]|nr:MAG: hypothetical protein M1827_002668 [Pycnora praestabilis]